MRKPLSDSTSVQPRSQLSEVSPVQRRAPGRMTNDHASEAREGLLDTVAGKAKDLKDGAALAAKSIDSGEAEGRLDRLIAVSNATPED